MVFPLKNVARVPSYIFSIGERGAYIRSAGVTGLEMSKLDGGHQCQAFSSGFILFSFSTRIYRLCDRGRKCATRVCRRMPGLVFCLYTHRPRWCVACVRVCYEPAGKKSPRRPRLEAACVAAAPDERRAKGGKTNKNSSRPAPQCRPVFGLGIVLLLLCDRQRHLPANAASANHNKEHAPRSRL